MEFLKANAAKLSIIGVMFAVALVLFIVRGGDEGKARTDKAQFICVSTGKIYWLKRKARTFPVENPDTGQLTLIPCYESEDGVLKVAHRRGYVLDQLDKEGLNQYVDTETLVVRVAP